MLRLSDHRTVAAELAGGVNDLDGIQGSATGLALVAAGVLAAAVGAGATHVAVGQELVTVFTVELLRRLLREIAVLQEREENVLSDPVVVLGVRVGEEVVGQAQLDEPVQESLMIAFEDLPGRDASAGKYAPATLPTWMCDDE